MKNSIRLVLSIAAPLLAGAIGGLATTSAVRDWYPALAKPAFTPPEWVFGPVWTALYLLMGVSLFLAWRNGVQSKTQALAVGAFAFQLAVNALWSPVFFGARAPGPGLLIILVLDVAVVATLVLMSRVSRTATLLLAPYLLWILFATALNFEIWRLNA